MILEGVSLLPSQSLAIWSDTTEATIADEVARILINQVESIDVTVTATSQVFEPNRRRLQTDNNITLPGNLTIQYDVGFAIRSIVDGLDPKRYVGAAFDSEEDKDTYIDELQSSGDENFDTLVSVRTELVDATVVVPSAEREIDPDDGVSTGVLVGSIAAGVAGAALLAFLFFVFGRRREDSEDEGQVAGLDFFSVGTPGMVVDPSRRAYDPEISTLGDPITPEETMGMNIQPTRQDMSVDETTDLSLPYDYKKELVTNARQSLDEGTKDGVGSAISYSDVSSNIIEAQQKGEMGTLDEETLDYQYSPNSSGLKPTHSY